MAADELAAGASSKRRRAAPTVAWSDGGDGDDSGTGWDAARAREVLALQDAGWPDAEVTRFLQRMGWYVGAREVAGLSTTKLGDQLLAEGALVDLDALPYLVGRVYAIGKQPRAFLEVGTPWVWLLHDGTAPHEWKMLCNLSQTVRVTDPATRSPHIISAADLHALTSFASLKSAPSITKMCLAMPLSDDPARLWRPGAAALVTAPQKAVARVYWRLLVDRHAHGPHRLGRLRHLLVDPEDATADAAATAMYTGEAAVRGLRCLATLGAVQATDATASALLEEVPRLSAASRDALAAAAERQARWKARAATRPALLAAAKAYAAATRADQLTKALPWLEAVTELASCRSEREVAAAVAAFPIDKAATPTTTFLPHPYTYTVAPTPSKPAGAACLVWRLTVGEPVHNRRGVLERHGRVALSCRWLPSCPCGGDWRAHAARFGTYGALGAEVVGQGDAFPDQADEASQLALGEGRCSAAELDDGVGLRRPPRWSWSDYKILLLAQPCPPPLRLPPALLAARPWLAEAYDAWTPVKVNRLVASTRWPRELGGATDLVCDHVNRCPWDDRLPNLRPLTRKQNTDRARKEAAAAQDVLHIDEGPPPPRRVARARITMLPAPPPAPPPVAVATLPKPPAPAAGAGRPPSPPLESARPLVPDELQRQLAAMVQGAMRSGRKGK